MKIFTDFVQYSDSWWEKRRGLVTASQMNRVMTPKTCAVSKSADDYICELVAESVTHYSLMPEGFISPAMKNGQMLEPEIRRFYEMERNVDLTEVGGCLSDCGRFWCSPDALCGSDGGLEAKGPLPKTHTRYLLDGVLPEDYKIQIHASLLITGRDWWDFISYVPGMPAFIVRTYPDHYTRSLANCLEQFWKNYQSALAKVRSIGSALEVKQEPAKSVDSLAGTPLEETKAANRKTSKRNKTFAQDTIDAHAAELPDYLKPKGTT